MKKKLKQMKRRWRKLEKADRMLLGIYGVIIISNIPLICFGLYSSISTILWLLLLVNDRLQMIKKGRVKAARAYFICKAAISPVVERLCRELSCTEIDLYFVKNKYDDLKQAHNKLECDYHRLKKQSKSNNKTRKS